MAGPQPIFEADLVTAALQPLNVQMGILCKGVLELTAAASKAPQQIQNTGSSLKAMLTSMGSAATSAGAAVHSLVGMVSGSAGQVVSGIGGMMSQVIGMVGQAATAIGGPIGEVVGMVAGAVSKIVNTVAAGIGQMIDTSMQLARMFDPGIVELFTRHMNNLMAAIGENLVPIVKAATEVVKFLGNTVAGMTGEIKPMVRQLVEALRPIFETLGGMLRGNLDMGLLKAGFDVLITCIDLLSEGLKVVAPIAMAFVSIWSAGQKMMLGIVQIMLKPFELLAFVMQPFGPILSAMAAIFSDLLDTFFTINGAVGELIGQLFGLEGGMQEVFDAMAQMMKDLVAWVRAGLNEVREFFGLSLLGDRRPGDASGKAATAAAFKSTDEVWKDVAKSIFGAGRGEAETAPIKSESHLAAIKEWLVNGPLVKAIDAYKKAVENPAGAAGEVVNSASDTVEGWLRDMWRKQMMHGD